MGDFSGDLEENVVEDIPHLRTFDGHDWLSFEDEGEGGEEEREAK